MAKRELSSTLRNLKFMNRATQKDEKAKKEVEIKDDGNFASPSQTRKCMVIMEGNPPPGALKGRMSFQSFNPSIDKLNEEATNLHQPPMSTTTPPDRDSRFSQTSSEATFISRTTSSSDSDGDHKRKQTEDGDDHGKQQLNKSSRNSNDGTPNNGYGSRKQQQPDKLNWNLLRPPKPTSKRN